VRQEKIEDPTKKIKDKKMIEKDKNKDKLKEENEELREKLKG